MFLWGEAAVLGWLNGREITSPAGIPLYLHPQPDSASLEVRLAGGENRLVLAVFRVRGGRWWLACRLGRYCRDRLGAKVLVSLARRLGKRFPAEASRALVAAAEGLLSGPESEPDFACALLERVRSRRSVPLAVRRDACRLLRVCYRRANRPLEEARVIEDFLALEGGGPIPPPTRARSRALLLMQLASAQFRAGRFAQAIATYERLLGTCQSGRFAVEALLALAERYRRMGLRERAHRTCRALLALMDARGVGREDRRRAMALALSDWSEARWTDRPYLQRDFEGERLLSRAEELRAGGGVPDDLIAALDLLVRAAGSSPSAVVPASSAAEGRLVGLRFRCQQRIRSLVEMKGEIGQRLLVAYRRRVEEEARAILQTAGTAYPFEGPRRLHALLSRYPLGPWAVEALGRLGGEAFSAGRVGEAALCFGRMLLRRPVRGWPGSALVGMGRDVLTAKLAFLALRRDPADAPWLSLERVSDTRLEVKLADRTFALEGNSGFPRRWFGILRDHRMGGGVGVGPLSVATPRVPCRLSGVLPPVRC